ncbi:DUF397 domain-containing protein [Streptomyces lasiicapitis]|uniref:DUF397 domain-containing protein n=1 Tax=Streptomyces lasiicapitis TaxID=1923961 RepID=A0ABQ2MR84_9ACTN|nr:DUF397 domain-containing protein [Streptomyces lasiicapitis]GGO56379.1 hypothetical protein GCM10012286_70710 [Streptomyces lasiicapitis]
MASATGTSIVRLVELAVFRRRLDLVEQVALNPSQSRDLILDVEVATTDHLIAVCDSKHPELPSAAVGREAWACFTDALGKEMLP